MKFELGYSIMMLIFLSIILFMNINSFKWYRRLMKGTWYIYIVYYKNENSYHKKDFDSILYTRTPNLVSESDNIIYTLIQTEHYN